MDVACLFKTRAEAQRACRAGKVEVGGQSAKPHRLVHPGDEIRITRGGLMGKQTVIVLGVAEHHVARAAARALYEDRTPPPPAAVVEARQLERLFWKSHPRPASTPDKRERRELRRLKGRI